MNTTHQPPPINESRRVYSQLAIRRDVINIIADLSDTNPDHVTPERELADLGLESLDFVEMIVEIEKKWNLSFTDSEMERIKTVGDCIAHVQRYS